MFQTNNKRCNEALALIDTIEVALKQLKTITHEYTKIDTAAAVIAVAKLASNIEELSCKK